MPPPTSIPQTAGASPWYAQPANAQLHDIVDTLDEAIQLWNADGRLIYANPASLNLFAVKCPLAEGASYEDFQCQCFHPNGEPLTRDDLPFVRVLRTGESLANEIVRTIANDGTEHWIRINCRPLFDERTGAVRAAVSEATDITDLIEQEHRLQQMAHFDALTRLPNRVLLADRMRQTLARSQRTREIVAVCLLDLDGFKPVNDNLGHKAGDQVLREVAQRLTETVRIEDTVARLGGDEFALLLGGMKTPDECDHVLKRILANLAQPYQVGAQTAEISASIGVTLFPQDGSDQDILLRHADQAMYLAKQAGKNRYMLFDAGQERRTKANQAMLRKIESGIADNQFRLYYQPKVDCRKGRVVGAEALVRWQHPVLGLLSPAEFLPLIEHDDLIVLLGDWALRDGLAQVAEWMQLGIDLKISVNISARQLHRKDFVDTLRGIAAGYPREVLRNLEVEIVETAALEDVNAVGDAIRECHELGIGVALDDFGTGFSSLVHLKRLSADALKIDQTFVMGMLDDPEDLAIVEGVIGLAGAFKRQVVAEGVESIDHILLLLELGCTVMQGYGLARPMGAEHIPQWVANFRPDPLWDLSSSPRPNRDYFELLLAEANHRSWIDQMLVKARLHGKAAELQGLLDPDRCRFGKWYQGEGRRRFRSMAAFADIDRVHRAVHQCAGALSQASETDDAEAIRKAEAAMMAADRQLISLLHELRTSLAKEMLGGLH